MAGSKVGAAAQAARRAFAALPRGGKAAVVAALVAGPALAYVAFAPDGGTGAAAPEGAPAASAAAPAATTANDGGDSFFRQSSAVLTVDLDSLREELASARDYAGPVDDDEVDFDEALELLEERAAEAADDGDLLEAIADEAPDAAADRFVAQAFALLADGDAWGAVAQLLVAHQRDEDAATPLVAMAAIANGQRLPGVALALLEAAEERIGDEAAAGIGLRAALANNRGHALLLLERDDEAEEALRAALALNPELSEAARNLAFVLLRRGEEDEARRLLPRVAYRLPGRADAEVPVRPASDGTEPSPHPSPAGSEADLRRWVAAPWLESGDSGAGVPLWVALDLSRQGQVEWPQIEYPTADASYAQYAAAMTARGLAAWEVRAALEQREVAVMAARMQQRQTFSDLVQQTIGTMQVPEWTILPIDTDMYPLSTTEPMILAGSQRTRFQALDVAQAEFRMEEAAVRLAVATMLAVCPENSDYASCCAFQRDVAFRHIGEMHAYTHEYEEQMAVFFRDAYGLSTAIVSNIPEGPWHSAARMSIEAAALDHFIHTQSEIASAYSRAAMPGLVCADGGEPGPQVAPAIKVDAPACSADSQAFSGKWSLGDAFSVEATCGKLKFVAEVNVIGTRATGWGKGKPFEASLGMHAEAEFSIDGTITVFAGPKFGVAGELAGFSGDFGVKDGIYAVIGNDGVRDVGMRVVVGGGAGGGPAGATHDVDSMDFSFVSAI